MKFTFHLTTGVGKTILSYIIIGVFLLLTATLLSQVESFLFVLIRYKWKGTSDITFWLLGLIELLSGIWLFMASRRGPGKWSFIGAHSEDAISILCASIEGGFFMGLAFSGFWKIVLMLGYWLIGFKHPL